ncbi:MAG TPA: hypothetical protein VH187_04235 [Scandinavium sp.]|jgi:hypothetical protein|uniref:hypothetical protein n=1 Tax=Scandinavium sp. TaxID=2830653 RepID=UPI002E367373|nr:hypothetical protein [Scandinavium sp.]HEX4500369.1 hypothetical protein [Scandinavium sp.]
MGRILEGYLYSDGVVIKLQKQTTNDSSPRYEEMRDGDPVINDIAKDVSQIQSLMTRVRGRKSDDTPTTSGSCITDAFIMVDNTEAGREKNSELLVSPNLTILDFLLKRITLFAKKYCSGKS